MPLSYMMEVGHVLSCSVMEVGHTPILTHTKISKRNQQNVEGTFTEQQQ